MSLARVQRRRRPELNLVPLIDVLVMLIFFAFVTMQFKSATTLNIKLPKVETAGKNDLKKSIEIEIDEKGTILLQGVKVTDNQLLAELQAQRDRDRTISVLIKADEKSLLGKLTFVIDACRKNGLDDFKLQSRN